MKNTIKNKAGRITLGGLVTVLALGGLAAAGVNYLVKSGEEGAARGSSRYEGVVYEQPQRGYHPMLNGVNK